MLIPTPMGVAQMPPAYQVARSDQTQCYARARAHTHTHTQTYTHTNTHTRTRTRTHTHSSAHKHPNMSHTHAHWRVSLQTWNEVKKEETKRPKAHISTRQNSSLRLSATPLCAPGSSSPPAPRSLTHSHLLPTLSVRNKKPRVTTVRR